MSTAEQPIQVYYLPPELVAELVWTLPVVPLDEGSARAFNNPEEEK